MSRAGRSQDSVACDAGRTWQLAAVLMGHSSEQARGERRWAGNVDKKDAMGG